MAGRRIPTLRIPPSYIAGHAACQAGTYVDGLRAAVTRVPLDRFVYLYTRADQMVVAVWLLYRSWTVGLGGLGECRDRLSPTPSASTESPVGRL